MGKLALLHKGKIVRHSNTVAAGVSTITPGTAIDMQNFESVLFIAEFGAIVAGGVTSIEAHQSAASGSGFTALLGTLVSITDAQDNKVLALEVVKPRERYVKCVVNRATQNATLEGITAILTGPKKLPTTQDATVAASEAHTSPAEGTA